MVVLVTPVIAGGGVRKAWHVAKEGDLDVGGEIRRLRAEDVVVLRSELRLDERALLGCEARPALGDEDRDLRHQFGPRVVGALAAWSAAFCGGILQGRFIGSSDGCHGSSGRIGGLLLPFGAEDRHKERYNDLRYLRIAVRTS